MIENQIKRKEKTAKEIRRKRIWVSLAVKREKKEESSPSYPIPSATFTSRDRTLHAIVVDVGSTSTSSWRRNHPSSSFAVMWQLTRTLRNAASRTR
jgi:hypothetical protein